MPRVLLLLPTATYRAEDFVTAAAHLGVEVVVGSEHRQAMADAMNDRALVVPFDRPDTAVAAIADLHARSPIDAVVAVDDPGAMVAALAAERLGLSHNLPSAVARTHDKASMRTALAGQGVCQPAFAVLAADDDAGAVARGVGFPCVVKPTGLSASRGVIRADDPDGAIAAAARSRAIAIDAGAGEAPALLVESFVPGPELAVEGLLRDGVLEVLAVFDKPDPLDGPFFEETIYVTPSSCPAATLDAVAATVAQASSALGLTEGPVHAEVRLHDGRVWLIEVAARSIGGLCARTLRFGAGVSLEELILAHALGRPLDHIRREALAAGVMMLPIPRSGVLRAVGGIERARAVDGVVGLEITVPKGRRVQTLPEGDRYLGFVFARAETAGDVEHSLRMAHRRLDIVIDD